MKVFISWSGQKSKAIANVFKEYLPMIIQEAEPFVSSIDIEKGNRWSNEISSQLEETNFGIICVTKDNVNSPWLNFEAGALSKSIDTSKVCPFLFDIQASDLTGTPLTQFQLTVNTKTDILSMFKSLNSSLNDKRLDESTLKKIFETFWAPIEKDLTKISTIKKDSDKEIKRESNEVLEEILKLLNNQNNVLNNPEKLFPPDYIKYIIEKSSILTYNTNFNYILNRSDLMRIDRACRCIQKSGSHFSDNLDYVITIDLLKVLLNVVDSSIDDWNKKRNYSNLSSDKFEIERHIYIDDLIRSTINLLSEQRELDNKRE